VYQLKAPRWAAKAEGEIMIDRVQLGKDILKTIGLHKGAVSIAVQNVDTGFQTFSNVNGIQFAQNENAVMFYTPGEQSWWIPYTSISHYITHDDGKGVEINFDGRSLLSLRGARRQQ
jgi:hypothetical protein